MQPETYKDFYTNESDVYHSSRYNGLYGKLFQQLHHETLTEMLKKTTTDKVLEVACGTGHTSTLLSDLGIKSIACDLTPAMMDKAKARLSGKDIIPEFMEADAFNLPFEDHSFDVLISTRFLHLFAMDKQEELFAEFNRVLKPGGHLIVDFDNWSSRWLMAVPYLFYNLVKYQRIAPFSIYNKIAKTKSMLLTNGINPIETQGIGGTHLILPSMVSFGLGLKLGRANRSLPLRIFAEQFAILGQKQ